jgi:hypothetical protein
MFPPKETEDPQVLVRGLWESLQRAGEHFRDEASLIETEDGFLATLYPHTRLSSETKKLISSFSKSYAKTAGWKMKTYFQPGIVSMALSRA